MVSGRTRKVVVIRDLHSNLIEEAILVLKEEHGGENPLAVGNKQKDDRKEARKQDVLLKEANLIIENYIRESKMRGLAVMEKQTRKGFLQHFLKKGIMINLALAGSLILLGLILTRLI